MIRSGKKIDNIQVNFFYCNCIGDSRLCSSCGRNYSIDGIDRGRIDTLDTWYSPRADELNCDGYIEY